MNADLAIDQLGGTDAVALLCQVTPAAVSQWRRNGLPKSRVMFLKALHPTLGKLSFSGVDEMSLRTAIEKNTEALNALLAHLKGVSVAPMAPSNADVVDRPPSHPQAQEPITQAPDVLPGPTLTYDEVKDGVMALSAKKGRGAVVTLLKAQGVAKVQDLRPEQYGRVMADVKAAMEAV